jgi:membrane protein implicated in regulation of membrane protease activity
MAHWPKTIRGNALALLGIIVAVPVVGIIAVALSGPAVWAGLVIITFTTVALIVWRRRIQSTRERTWTREFSFASVVVTMRAKEAAEALIVEQRRAELLGSEYPKTVTAGAR